MKQPISGTGKGQTMTTAFVDELGSKAATIMMKGAVDYARSIGREDIVRSDRGADMAVAALKAAAPNAIRVAMAEAREAFDANMPDVGRATFIATMKLSGIAAMKVVVADYGQAN